MHPSPPSPRLARQPSPLGALMKSPPWSAHWRKPRLFLFWALVAAIVAAALGEGWLSITKPPPPPPPSPSAPQAVVLVIDTSGSMSDGSLEEVKQAAKAYVTRQDMARTRIGIVDFGSQVKVDSPLTRDPAALTRALDSLQPDGLTRMDLGLQEAGNLLGNRTSSILGSGAAGESGNVLLFTDGQPTDFLFFGGSEATKKAAQGLNANGIGLVAIGSASADTDYLAELTGSPQLVFRATQGNFDGAFTKAEAALRKGTRLLISSGVERDTDEGRALWRLSGWNAILGGMLAFALVLAQARVTRARLGKTELLAVVLGIGVGAFVGALSQGTASLFLSAGSLGLALGRIIGWALLGIGAAIALALSLPNVRRFPILVGGAAGGIIGAVAFTVATRVGGDVAGRWVGAMAIGAGVGLMIALAEVAARRAWITVSFGPVDSYDLALGEEAIAIGSDRRSCRAFVPAIEPVAARYGFQSGAAFIAFPDGRREPLSEGDNRTFGKASVTLHLERGTASPAVNTPMPFKVPGMEATVPGVQAPAPTPPAQWPTTPAPTHVPSAPVAASNTPILRWKWSGSEVPVSIEKGNYSLGRAADNTIVLNESAVSSHHARLELRGGRWMLTDLGSTNGTFIGETRLQPHVPVAIPVGQDVRLGSLLCRFERS